MRKLVISVSLIAGMIFGLGAGIAAPGPNGNNDHGLCTAYFNGSQMGMDNKRKAGPFVELAKKADTSDDGKPGTPSEVWAWCLPDGPSNNDKNIGGNPTDPTSDTSTPPGGGGGGASATETETGSSNKGGKKK